MPEFSKTSGNNFIIPIIVISIIVVIVIIIVIIIAVVLSNQPKKQETPGQETPGQETPEQGTPGQGTPGQGTPGQTTSEPPVSIYTYQLSYDGNMTNEEVYCDLVSKGFINITIDGINISDITCPAITSQTGFRNKNIKIYAENFRGINRLNNYKINNIESFII